MTEEERLAKRRFEAYFAFETMPPPTGQRYEWASHEDGEECSILVPVRRAS